MERSRMGSKVGPAKLVALVLALAAVSCAPPGERSVSGNVQQRAAPKRLIAAIAGDPVSLSQQVTRATLAYSVPGGAEIERLAHRGLTTVDEQGELRPELAEAVPTTENGLWALLPDGRMETTWRIRQTARWHDGTPVTGSDLVFSATVTRDRDLPVFADRNFRFVESVEASDPRTVVVRWKQPFIDADRLFNSGPLPQHLLESAYREDKANFVNYPYWTHDFVGTGPYQLREWEQGSHVRLAAYDGYVHGRPKIDEIEVRFIPDSNTLIANVLAGEVELTLGRGFSIEQAIRVREQWESGTAQIAPSSWVVIFPQFTGPTPAVVANTQFRRALMHALDRQQMAESIQGGLVPVAHVFLDPGQPGFKEAEAAAVRYEYDPRRALQLIEGLGYARGPDGVFRDVVGQRLSVQIWTSGGLDIQVKSMLAVADAWQHVAVGAEPVVVPTQRWNDREYVASFPGFRLNRQGSGLSFLQNRHSSQTPLPENNFVGQNYSRYRDSEFDALIDRFFVTVPLRERMEVLQQVVRHMTDEALLLGLYYDAQPILVARRLAGVTASNPGWNVHIWEIQG